MTAASLAVSAGLAACGGHAATRADVIARGDATCAKALADIRAVSPPSGDSAAALATYLRRVRPILDGEATALAALPRPSDRRPTLLAFQRAFHTVADGFDAAARDAQQGERSTAIDALSAVRSPRVAALARSYGLRACTGTQSTLP